MYLDEPVSTSLLGFHATHLAQVASFCKPQRLRGAVATSWHMTEQISSFTPHYSDQREPFSSTSCNTCWNAVFYVYHSKATNDGWHLTGILPWYSMGQKQKHKDKNKAGLTDVNAPLFIEVTALLCITVRVEVYFQSPLDYCNSSRASPLNSLTDPCLALLPEQALFKCIYFTKF